MTDGRTDRAHRMIRPEAPWLGRRACRFEDRHLFFIEIGQPSQAAKAICARCPVREECLQYALDNHDRFGIYGGLTYKERRQVARQRTAA